VAKPIRKDSRRKTIKDDRLPLARENFIVIGVGILVIIAGYLAMLGGSIEGFRSLVLAPLLLVAGYCVIIPFGILYRRGMFRRAQDPAAASEETR
jgi:hypothetical protein